MSYEGITMNQGPVSVPVKTTAEDERKIAAMGSLVEIQEYMHRLAEEQGLASRDPWTKELLAVPGAVPAAKTATVKVGETTYEISYNTPEELVAAELELYRTVVAPKPATAQPAAQPRDTTGKFTAGDQNTNDAAIEDYLQRNGIDLSAQREQRYRTDWESSGNEFMARHPEWAGGASNLQALGTAVLELGLSDSPSADALETAYTEIKRRGQYDPNTAELQAAKAEQQISGAVDHESIRSLGRRALGQPASGYFER